MTAAPITIRLTYSSNSTVSMPAWVPRNAVRLAASGELTFRVSAAASSEVSAGVTRVARLRASYRPCAWSAFRPPTASGNSHSISRPGARNAFCISASWSGSASSPPTQYGVALGGWARDGTPATGSCCQKVEPLPCCRTIAVTTSVTAAPAVASVRRLPGCSANRAAVCGVAATATVPLGSAGPVRLPATSAALLISGSR